MIQCQYDYPVAHFVTSVAWSKYDQGSRSWISLGSLAAPPDSEYVGNFRGDCSLRINRIQPIDSGYYSFRFVTTWNSWMSKTWSHVSVKGLTSAVQPSSVTEGDDVQLTCVSGCPTLPETVWFRDDQLVTDPGQVFQASRGDAGRYQCALKELKTVRSASATLKVQYAPEKVTLSMTPSEAAVKGGLVTFGCSSDASPPVERSGYRLFKDGHLVRTGPSLNMPDIQPSHSGLYHCQAWNNVSRKGIQYFNSTIVHLDVQYRPVNVSISTHLSHVMAGSGVNLTCSSDSNPAADNYTWYRKTHATGSMQQVGSGQLLSLLAVEASHSGLYLCQAWNQLGEGNSTELLLSVEDVTDSSHSVLAIAGVGVVLFVALGIALLFWRKQKCSAGTKENTGDPAYVTALPEPRQDAWEDEVIYTTVTTIDNGHIYRNRSKEWDDPVIYSTVVYQ